MLNDDSQDASLDIRALLANNAMSASEHEDRQHEQSAVAPHSYSDAAFIAATAAEGAASHTDSVQSSQIAQQLRFISHQLVRLIESTGHTPCACRDCGRHLKSIARTPTFDAQPPVSTTSSTQPSSVEKVPEINTKVEQPELSLATITRIVNRLGDNVQSTAASFGDNVEHNEDGSLKRGRKSKYCGTSAKKRELAEYAALHGATAAARKFNLPASVAAYYYRKLKKSRDTSGETALSSALSTIAQCAPPPAVSSPLAAHGSLISTATDGDIDEQTSSQDLSGMSAACESGDPIVISTVSSGCMLRGRARGRPRLIGDALDHELVEYMVHIKNQLPRNQMLTAAHALELSHAYIKERSPHILAENGGHVTLKMTWAMKLVSRTNERWKELNGSPAPSLVVDESVFPQHLDATFSDLIAELRREAKLENQDDVHSNAEVTNVQALKFPFVAPL